MNKGGKLKKKLWHYISGDITKWFCSSWSYKIAAV